MDHSHRIISEPAASGVPPNQAATAEWSPGTGAVVLTYEDTILLSARVSGSGAAMTAEYSDAKGGLTQAITFSGKGLRLDGLAHGSTQAIAAETRGAAQTRFPLVRTSHGASRNLRNNAVYDRERDWALAALADGSMHVMPCAESDGGRPFVITCSGDRIRLEFRPHFYQKHKNIPHFQPWSYRVREDSITGWCSWWAYMRTFTQKDCDALLSVWKEKRLADYGYRFIQIDDCFQGGEHAKHTLIDKSGYLGGHPDTWLEWRADVFPAGMDGFVRACRNAGFEPAIWMASHFGTKDIIDQHPDWFVRGQDGNPFIGPWVAAAVDTTNQEAVDTLVRPAFRGVRKAGFPYVKIDSLRHYLYDNLHLNPEYCRTRGVSPADVFRGFLRAAREELGPDAFILACWGVLPEAVGLADACRIGGDGYGPATMQQYNSWNGIVWMNDPDHCDIYPKLTSVQTGNVTKLDAATADDRDPIIRPALASIAGCMLMLSDKPEVYRDEKNLRGLRRSAPVLFSVPGQLYDFDPRKTGNLRDMERTSIQEGTNPSPIDADQFGDVCEWWLNEFDLSFEHWTVLHRLNWTDHALPEATVSFADIGLDPEREYLVYEFWSGRFVGACKGSFAAPEGGAKTLQSYALREKLDRPQIVSTNRHISQGAADLTSVSWDGAALSGSSKVVNGDRYELAIHVSDGYAVTATGFAGHPADARMDGTLARVAFTPEATGEVSWSVAFSKH